MTDRVTLAPAALGRKRCRDLIPPAGASSPGRNKTCDAIDRGPLFGAKSASSKQTSLVAGLLQKRCTRPTTLHRSVDLNAKPVFCELLAAGVRPDLIVGVSAGAINGSFLAHDPSAASRVRKMSCRGAR
jgi:hypothetical protein